jgi:hypothetical protein
MVILLLLYLNPPYSYQSLRDLRAKPNSETDKKKKKKSKRKAELG